jgi:serine phosphatase RsbU (regulator of sigma subunit)/anti-sigma regulatory factor (Ser/Thr protein kinase)
MDGMDGIDGIDGVAPASVDWATTALGPRDRWPDGLAAVVSLVLEAPVPMALALGADAVLVYNSPYAGILGSKHPAAFGRPAGEVLAENWTIPGHGDVVEQVRRTGEPFLEPDTVLPVLRRGADGPAELVHFSRAYSPVRADDGTILGVLSVVSETSEVSRALSGVAELTARLSSAVGVDDVAREALRYAVEVVGADHARVVLADGPTVRMARRAKIDGSDETVERLPPVWVRLDPETALPSVQVTRSGEALWLDASGVPGFEDLKDEPLAIQRLNRVASLPLRTGRVRGALSLGWDLSQDFSAAERSALTAVANLVAQSMARAQRFDEQRDLAESLQLSMLPTSLPQLPGIGIAGRYAPSGPDAAAGGDFYDAFTVDSGQLVLVIGDVVGHGVRAATVMGQVRAAARVLALRDPEPSRVLSALDPFVASLGVESFVTMVVAVLDPLQRTIWLSCAGHPLPVLCHRGHDDGPSAAAVAAAVGTPVGIADERPITRLALHKGDVLVFYTDGVVEVPGEDPDVGLKELVAAIENASTTSDPRRVGTLLLENRRAVGDDAALLVLALQEQRHRVAAIDLPPEALIAARARSWAKGVLAAWGMSGSFVDDALLGLSELVSNALLHARTGTRVELDLDDHRLLVLVTDGGTHSEPVPGSADPTAIRGRGLAVVDELATVWGSEQSSRGTTVWFELARPAEV